MDRERNAPLQPMADDRAYKPEFVIVFSALAICGALVGFLVGYLYR